MPEAKSLVAAKKIASYLGVAADNDRLTQVGYMIARYAQDHLDYVRELEGRRGRLVDFGGPDEEKVSVDPKAVEALYSCLSFDPGAGGNRWRTTIYLHADGLFVWGTRDAVMKRLGLR